MFRVCCVFICCFFLGLLTFVSLCVILCLSCRCLPLVVRSLLGVGCCLLFVVRCSLSIASCFVLCVVVCFAVYCLSFGVFCFVACCVVCGMR